MNSYQLFKDKVLDELAENANVAQFVSFGSTLPLKQRYSRIRNYVANHHFKSARKAIQALLVSAPEHSVNVRSYRPDQPKGGVFTYGLKNSDDVLSTITKNASEHRFSIVNETIDVNDGGVSGVVLDRIIEFSPNDTPKCVDKKGVCALPRKIGLKILEQAYGIKPNLEFAPSHRVEFSIHPRRRGIRHEHTIIWEIEEVGKINLSVNIRWPNNFSRHLGDKAYGLLIASTFGLPVPKTTVIARTIAPFTFGIPTGTGEVWVRSCPEIRVPGKYPTQFGWTDPFKLVYDERDTSTLGEENSRIVSILSQESVHAEWSGSLITTKDNKPFIEGVRGSGEDFMLGKIGPEKLPANVKYAVLNLYEHAYKHLNAVEMEWVHDGNSPWIVQIHKSYIASNVKSTSLSFQQLEKYHYFDIQLGIEALRKLINTLKGQNQGIILVGNIGITSHFGDILRSAGIPYQIESTFT